MSVVVLDPGIAAVPPYVSTEEELEAFLERLLDWSGAIIRDNNACFGLIEDAIDALAAANCYPSRPNIAALLDMYDLSHVYSARDIENSINVIIQRCASLEDVLDIRLDLKIIEPNPDVFLICVDPILKEAGERSLAIAACCLVGFGRGLADVSFVPAYLNSRELIAVRVSVKSIANSLSEAQVDGPLSFLVKVPAPYRYVEVPTHVNPMMLWERATTATEIHWAIAAQAFQFARAANANFRPEEVPSFHVGAAFIQSLRLSAAWRDGAFSGVVRTACARVLLGNCMPPPRPFRISAASDVQRTRSDGAMAFRVHVTEGGVGLRLMYWERTDGSVEFANVGPKHEEWIDDSVDHCAASGGL